MINPYMNIPAYQPNVLPQQQILQANGKQSIDALRMSPNSSVLIADSTEPIVWRCISDGLGNVTAEAFDITPHKTEEQQAQDELVKINERISRLEALYEQSIIGRNDEQFITDQTDGASTQKRRKSASNVKPGDSE